MQTSTLRAELSAVGVHTSTYSGEIEFKFGLMCYELEYDPPKTRQVQAKGRSSRDGMIQKHLRTYLSEKQIHVGATQKFTPQ